MRALIISSVATLALMTGCAKPRGKTMLEKQQFVRNMRTETLNMLYKSRPDLEQRIHDAVGYGVFSTVNLKVLLLKTGHGYGVVMDNRDDSETFMRMAEVGAGVGAGFKDLRAIFVFPSQSTMDNFVRKGWSFGGEAQAALKSGDVGGSVGSTGEASTSGASGSMAAESKSTHAATGSHGIEIYRITKTGVALQATLAGTKYWPDKKLNP